MAKTTLLEAHCKCFDFKLYIFLLYISPITIIPFTWFKTWNNSSDTIQPAISILSCLHPKFIRLQYAKNFRCNKKGASLQDFFSLFDISVLSVSTVVIRKLRKNQNLILVCPNLTGMTYLQFFWPEYFFIT